MILFTRQTSFSSKNTILAWVLCVLVILPVAGCGDNDRTPIAPDQNVDILESFTFFDLGAGTRLTKTIRQDLVDKLGSEAIEKRGILDLTIQPTGLLETRFNRLYTLNRNLNSRLGARVEHDITRLTYRYPRETTPFKFVQLVFSNATKRPLFFKLVLKKEGSATVDALRGKYGPPESIGEDPKIPTVLFWEKNGDTLIVSEQMDRFGEPEYHLMFYFVNNLDGLLEAETEVVEHREKELEKAGKTAF